MISLILLTIINNDHFYGDSLGPLQILRFLFFFAILRNYILTYKYYKFIKIDHYNFNKYSVTTYLNNLYI